MILEEMGVFFEIEVDVFKREKIEIEIFGIFYVI